MQFVCSSDEVIPPCMSAANTAVTILFSISVSLSLYSFFGIISLPYPSVTHTRARIQIHISHSVRRVVQLCVCQIIKKFSLFHAFRFNFLHSFISPRALSREYTAKNLQPDTTKMSFVGCCLFVSASHMTETFEFCLQKVYM